MSFNSITKFKILSPLNVINRLTLEQREDSLDPRETARLLRFCPKKKSFLRMKLIFMLVGILISKIAKLPYLGLRKLTRGLTEANTPFTSNDCLVRLVEQRLHQKNFLLKWKRCNHYIYRTMIIKFFAPALHGIDMNYVWF